MANNENVTVNREYKDSVFRLLFTDSKENALSLYNAINGTDYDNPEDIYYTNLEDAFYLNIKNDVSFVFSRYLSIYEHQSTLNHNMPLRGLMYATAMYRGMVDPQMLFRNETVKIPAPKYVVFYNGEKDCEDVIKLRLSDMFEVTDDSGDFEWTATMININYGHNVELMKHCQILEEYAIFISKTREYFERYRNRMNHDEALRKAIRDAVEDCIAQGVLEDFLKKKKREVLDMSLFEFTEEEFVKMHRDEAREEGREEGREEERKSAVKKMIEKGWDKASILDLEYTEAEYNAAMAETEDDINAQLAAMEG